MWKRGAVLAVTLVCLLVVTMLGGLLLRALLLERRQSAQRSRQAQTMWLAESAVARARARLAATPDYAGETWTITAETLGDRWPATVTIRVAAVDASPQARTIVVEAVYPDDPEHRIVQRREVLYEQTP